MQLEYGVSTSTGRVRRRNEDSYACNPDIGLFIVADGMGGHPDGHIASAIAVNKTEEQYKQSRDLVAAIRFADSAIRKTPPRGMGTTIVAAAFTSAHVQVAHAGDSRLYMSRQGSLYALTRDHTVAGRSGLPDHSNVLLNALGIRSEMPLEVTLSQFPVQRGDIYVLCSDGLYGELEPPDMGRILTLRGSMQEISEALVDTAVEHGGRDNVTVISVRIS